VGAREDEEDVDGEEEGAVGPPAEEELEEAKEGAENRKPKRTSGCVAALAVKDVVDDVGACAAAGGADSEELSSANAAEEPDVEDARALEPNAAGREPNAPLRAARGGEGYAARERMSR
jgi:hypothetical protein